MILWILQMALNIVFGYFAFLWLVSKKRIFWLEAQIEMLNQALDQKNREASEITKVETKEPQDRGQLIEKYMQNDPRKTNRPSPDAYDRADVLLARGVDLKEVARQTGLSLAELQLMGKVSARVQ
jgi:hypothetical protein